MRFPLRFETPSEADRGDVDEEPSDLIGNSHEVLEPCPELSSANIRRAKTKNGDRTRSEDRDPRDFVPVQFRKELGRVAIFSEGVEQPGPCEERVVSSGNDTRHDDGVHEASCDVGSGHLEDDREGGGGGGFGGGSRGGGRH